MRWRKAAFKGKTVWAEVDDSGELRIQEGRVAVRYSPAKGAKIYRAGALRVAVLAESSATELPPGTDADGPSTSALAGSGSGPVRGGRSGGGARAARAASELLDALPDNGIRAFTDGACRGNPGPAGAGVYIEFPDGRKMELARSLGRGTNNIAELTAIELALQQIEREQPDGPVALLTDSSYAIGVLSKGWKAKANPELVARVRKRLREVPDVQLHWVAGHVGTEGNEKADRLANAGVDGLSFEQWVD